MATPEEPTRLSDLGELPEPWRAELSAYREQGPSEARVSRILALLEGGPARFDDALTEPVRDGASSEVLRATKRSAWRWSGAIVVASLLGALCLSWWIVRRAEAPASTPVAGTEPVIPAPVASGPTVARPAPQVAAPRIEPAAEELAPPRRALPSARRSAPSQPNSDPMAELAMLSRARRLLAAEPSQALALTEEHRAHYPRGAFAEEREVLAIEALIKLARSAEAERRGRAFLRAHPGSAHGERVRVLLASNPG